MKELQQMLAAVDLLAAAMKKKLRQKAREGYSGGLDSLSRHDVAKSLHEHAQRLTGFCTACRSIDGEHDYGEGAAQAVDVCNLAMMLWVQGGGVMGKVESAKAKKRRVAGEAK